MKQSIALVAVVVREYDEALAFYLGVLGFTLVEDRLVPEQNKRWVVVSPPGATESRILLARASNDEQASRVGSQTGGRVFLFLCTDDFARDYLRYKNAGVEFVREPKEEPYGTVAVFKDLYGNLWDLVQPGIPDGDSQLTRFSHPTPELPVEDVERAQQHYRDVFGFEIGWLDPGKEIGAVSRDDAPIFLRKRSRPFDPAIHWVFAEDIDAMYDELRSLGAKIVEPLEKKPWGLRQFTVEDIDGNRFYFHCD